MRNIVIMPSAGMGRRIGYKKKPFLHINGVPVLAYSVRVFEKSPVIDAIILVVQPGDEDLCRSKIVEKFSFRKVIKIVAGGSERQDSIMLALASISGRWDIVLVHDGVRPFITNSLIEAVMDMAGQEGSAVVAVPVKDTVKKVVDGKIVRTLNREELWAVQTPQAFRYEILQEAYSKAKEDGFYGTDDSMLVERLGYPVSIVPGSYNNIKITTKEDISIANAVLAGM